MRSTDPHLPYAVGLYETKELSEESFLYHRGFFLAYFNGPATHLFVGEEDYTLACKLTKDEDIRVVLRHALLKGEWFLSSPKGILFPGKRD